ncbi:hypothetical protein BPOR_0480g00080 [Botrytis porri]|uniref:Uncharacterized protein n=1 Tax=Botrytis porri TaxID=87229 RepID=A0A4Z1KGG4_9HELO|nr:hypothetical protein BPOR_0480g00080 [Botrytis porri]
MALSFCLIGRAESMVLPQLTLVRRFTICNIMIGKVIPSPSPSIGPSPCNTRSTFGDFTSTALRCATKFDPISSLVQQQNFFFYGFYQFATSIKAVFKKIDYLMNKATI